MSSENMPIRQNTDGVLYKEEEYMKVFAKEHQPKKRGRPFGSKNTGITKNGRPDYYLKISHCVPGQEIIISFD